VQIVALDLEGVLVPEIWIAFSERTGIPELRRTTRDEPDYDKLMRFRLDLLRRHNLGLPDIQKVIGELGPMPGAKEFLDALRAGYQVVILSRHVLRVRDAAHGAARDADASLCHRLETDAAGFVTAYKLRMPDREGLGPRVPSDRVQVIAARRHQRHGHAR
jgi:phosphoserine/homoserine phosphotransferase